MKYHVLGLLMLSVFPSGALALGMQALPSAISGAPEIHLPNFSADQTPYQHDGALDHWVYRHIQDEAGHAASRNGHRARMKEHVRAVIMRHPADDIAPEDALTRISIMMRRDAEAESRAVRFRESAFDHLRDMNAQGKAAADIRAFLETDEGQELIELMSPAELRAIEVFLAAFDGDESLDGFLARSEQSRPRLPGLTALQEAGGEDATQTLGDGRNLMIRGWQAEKEEGGRVSVVNPLLEGSRLFVQEGMILGAFGRVLEIGPADADGTFTIDLDTGIEIPGQILVAAEDPQTVTMESAEDAYTSFGEIIVSQPPQRRPDLLPSMLPPPRPASLGRASDQAEQDQGAEEEEDAPYRQDVSGRTGE